MVAPHGKVGILPRKKVVEHGRDPVGPAHRRRNRRGSARCHSAALAHPRGHPRWPGSPPMRRIAARRRRRRVGREGEARIGVLLSGFRGSRWAGTNPCPGVGPRREQEVPAARILPLRRLNEPMMFIGVGGAGLVAQSHAIWPAGRPSSHQPAGVGQCGQLGAVVDLHVAHEPQHVTLDGADGEVHRLGHLRVGHPLADVTEHFQLARVQG